MTCSPLSHLEAVVNSGKAIISADDDTIVALVKATIERGRKATFYLYLCPVRGGAVMFLPFCQEPVS